MSIVQALAGKNIRPLSWCLAAVLTCLTFVGCGHIATYTDPDLKTGKTGILYYPPKPYLLVARTGAKDKPNDVQVIYLPDLSQPRYAVMKAGYGSSKLSLAFSNGVLVSAGQDTDPKITEAITALAGVPGALATAGKTRAEAASIRKESSDLPKAARALRDVATDIEKVVVDPRATRALSPTHASALTRLPQELRDAASILDRPDSNEAALDAVIKVMDGIKRKLSSIKQGAEVSDADRSFWASIRGAEAALDSVIEELKPKSEPPPTLTLYEVWMDGSGTHLREVPLSLLPNNVSR